MNFIPAKTFFRLAAAAVVAVSVMGCSSALAVAQGTEDVDVNASVSWAEYKLPFAGAMVLADAEPATLPAAEAVPAATQAEAVQPEAPAEDAVPIVYNGDGVPVSGPAPGTAGFKYSRVIECLATAYDTSPEENGGWGGQSATGVPLQPGVIAVDPRVIPLGSTVYVEALDGSWSYGYAVAADTGGAIKGKRVDLLFLTKGECYQFGRRSCRVYVL